MKVFISGGCKNGKSSYAERIAVKLAEHAKPLYYLATMRPADAEDRARVARHKQNRSGLGFETVEISKNISSVKSFCDMSGTFLLDSVTALLAGEMFMPDGGINPNAYKKIAGELRDLLNCAGNMIIVSDYIYSDAIRYDALTEDYRRGLAYIDICCAKTCDVVLEACVGYLIAHKGGDILDGIFKETR